MSFSRPTLKDVARLSGVSEISVSRVMRNAPNISTGLREKVEAAALELNYTPNKIAGALASNTTDLIGVMIPTLNKVEYTKVLSGVESVLGQSRYQVMLGISDFSAEQESKIIRDFLAWSPSGLIMVGVGHPKKLLENSKARCVGVLKDGDTSLAYGVRVSHEKACADLVSHWQKQGLRNIAFVGSNEEHLFTGGFKDVLALQLQKAGMSLVHQITTDESPTITLGMKFCSDILKQAHEVDAIFFADGDLAVGASFFSSLTAQEKIVLASFNNSTHIDTSCAPIDLISIDFETVGSNAAKLLSKLARSTGQTEEIRVNLQAEFVKSQHPVMI